MKKKYYEKSSNKVDNKTMMSVPGVFQENVLWIKFYDRVILTKIEKIS